MERTLTVIFNDGNAQEIPVHCGSDKNACRLLKRIGKALMEGTATATLDFDGLPRTAVLRTGRYYMRKA